MAAVIGAAGLRRPVLVGWSLGGFVAGAYLRKYGGSGVAGFNLVDAVTKLSPELLTPLAAEFTRRCTSHDLSERTAATAEFLAECFHRQPEPAEFQRMLVVNGMTARAVNEGFIKTATTWSRHSQATTDPCYSAMVCMTGLSASPCRSESTRWRLNVTACRSSPIAGTARSTKSRSGLGESWRLSWQWPAGGETPAIGARRVASCSSASNKTSATSILNAGSKRSGSRAPIWGQGDRTHPWPS